MWGETGGSGSCAADEDRCGVYRCTRHSLRRVTEEDKPSCCKDPMNGIINMLRWRRVGLGPWETRMQSLFLWMMMQHQFPSHEKAG